jgi:competence protein ComGC
MERNRTYIVIISVLLFVFVCLFSHQQKQINNQQEQIDELVKKNHVQDLRLRILERI